MSGIINTHNFSHKEQAVYQNLLDKVDYYYSVINYYISGTYTSIGDTMYNPIYKDIFDPILADHSEISKKRGQYIVNNYLQDNELWILLIIIRKESDLITLKKYKGGLRREAADKFDSDDLSFSYSEIDYKEENIKKLKYLFDNLRKAQQATEKDIYFYTIRPSVYKSGYDGSLTLASIDKLKQSEIQLFSVFFSGVFSSYIINRAITESIKSAVAAIMSRNMSHNLGSHVITHTKYQIDELSNLQKDDEIAEQLNGLTNLFQYLQERQDFVAVIANNEKYSNGPLNFKSAVFDFLAMDGPATRHNHNGSDKLKKVRNYLLNNIVSSEGIYRIENENNKTDIPIELQMIKYNNNDSYSIFRSLGDKYKLSEENASSDKFNDLLLSVPYGLNGRQALLTIIENIIRNSAKHDKDNLKHFNINNPLTFSIIFKEEKKFYSIVISDNKKDLTNVLQTFKHNNIIEYKDNGIKIKSLNIIDENNEIDTENKGIKEILICLSWLKNREYFEIQEEGKNNELLQIVGVDEKYNIFYGDDVSKKLSLGYKFQIEKYLTEYEISDEEQKENIPSAFMYKCSKGTLDKLNKTYTRIVEKGKSETIEKIYEEDLKKRFNIENEKLPVLLISEKVKSSIIDEEHNVLRYDEKIDEAELNKKIKEKYGEDHEKYKQIKYTTHYETLLKDTKNQTEDFIKLRNNEIFKEGISGSNYTHNLIRKSLNKCDYLKIVEAAYTKIAIVDERIFKKYDGGLISIKEKDFNTFFDETNSVSTVTAYYNEILPKYKEKNINFDGIEQRLWNSKNNFDCFKQEFLKKNNIEKFNYKAEYLEGKNIFIFNCNENGQLIDLRGNIIEPSFSPDFLSIHLTLLENIKIDGGDTIENKLKKLKENLNANSETKICVHSGRGGLANIKNVTFMPLSGIDWALDNCKYVLSELFYGMKY